MGKGGPGLPSVRLVMRITGRRFPLRVGAARRTTVTAAAGRMGALRHGCSPGRRRAAVELLLQGCPPRALLPSRDRSGGIAATGKERRCARQGTAQAPPRQGRALCQAEKGLDRCAEAAARIDGTIAWADG
jgi:hypothetical protein